MRGTIRHRSVGKKRICSIALTLDVCAVDVDCGEGPPAVSVFDGHVDVGEGI